MVNRIKSSSDDIYFLALVKKNERYVFAYDPAHRVDTLRMIGRWASNPELSLTWYDAANLSMRIKKEGVT